MTEEDELEMALAMSVEDISQPQASTSGPANVAAQAPAAAAADGPAPMSSSPTKATPHGMHERENASAVANSAAHQVTSFSYCAGCGMQSLFYLSCSCMTVDLMCSCMTV